MDESTGIPKQQKKQEDENTKQKDEEHSQVEQSIRTKTSEFQTPIGTANTVNIYYGKPSSFFSPDSKVPYNEPMHQTQEDFCLNLRKEELQVALKLLSEKICILVPQWVNEVNLQKKDELERLITLESTYRQKVEQQLNELMNRELLDIEEKITDHKLTEEQVQQLHQEEIQKGSNSIKYYYEKAVAYQYIEPEVSLWMSRITAEIICRQIFIQEISSNLSNIMPENFFQALVEKKSIDKHIVVHFKTIQNYGYYASNSYEKDPAQITPEYVKACLHSLYDVVTWYFNKYCTGDILSVKSPSEKTSKAQDEHTQNQDDVESSQESDITEESKSEKTLTEEEVSDVLMARESAETLCRQIFVREIPDHSGGLTWNHLLTLLEIDKILPPFIIQHLRTIQGYKKIAPQDREEVGRITPDDIQACLHSLSSVVKWFFNIYLPSTSQPDTGRTAFDVLHEWFPPERRTLIKNRLTKTFITAKRAGITLVKWSPLILIVFVIGLIGLSYGKRKLYERSTQVVFEDRFEDEFLQNANQWLEKDTEDVSLQLHNGRYVISHKRDVGAWLSRKRVNLEGYTDFSIQSTMQKVDGTDGHGYGLIWKATEADGKEATYAFRIASDGRYSFKKIYSNTFPVGTWDDYEKINSEWHSIIPWAEDEAIQQGNAENTLALVRKGYNIELVINDKPVDTAEFEGFLQNSVGFIVSNRQTVEIENIIITRLPSHVIFRDYFINNAYNWDEQNNQDVLLEVKEGKYIFSRQKGTIPYRTFKHIPVHEYENLSIETTMRKIDGANSDGYGIIWGDQHISNICVFEISGDGYYRYRKEIAGKKAFSQDWQESYAIKKYNSVNTLTLTKRGNVVVFSINGQTVDTTEVEELSGNDVGFIVSGKQTIAIEHIVVTGLR